MLQVSPAYLVAAALLGALAGTAGADSLAIGSLEYRDIQISGVKGEVIVFTTNTGKEIVKPIAQVTRISLDGDPAFSAAEDAYSIKQWDKATEGYEKTLRTTQKAWLRDWCAVRLFESANKGGRFDAAVKAHIALVRKSPEAAKALALTMPKSDSAYLPEAIKLVNEAANDANLNDQAKEVLLKVLVDLHNAKGDADGAAGAAERLIQIKAASDPNSPEAQRAAAMVKLNAMHKALAAKQYDKVIQLVDKEGTSIVDVADQADALLCLADAKAGKAANSTDLETWKDVAVAYMRVVANAPANAPQVPAALLKTAAIHSARLNDKQAAIQLYKQIQAEYKGQDAAKEAERELAKLG
jgi:hypothetical protein